MYARKTKLSYQFQTGVFHQNVMLTDIKFLFELIKIRISHKKLPIYSNKNIHMAFCHPIKIFLHTHLTVYDSPFIMVSCLACYLPKLFEMEETDNGDIY